MTDKDYLALLITSAFVGVPYPGDANLRNSSEGDEPFLVEDEFKGKTDWRTLDPAFLDHAPDGFGTALHFFTHEALRFYLPAYLIADVRGELAHADPLFTVTHGLDDSSRSGLINPRRFGEMTWYEYACQRFSSFSHEQASAVIAYLAFKRETDSFERSRIDEALRNYWNDRAK